MLNKFLIYRIHCIVLSDYAGGISPRWGYSKKPSPNGAKYLLIWEKAHISLVIKISLTL